MPHAPRTYDSTSVKVKRSHRACGQLAGGRGSRSSIIVIISSRGAAPPLRRWPSARRRHRPRAAASPCAAAAASAAAARLRSALAPADKTSHISTSRFCRAYKTCMTPWHDRPAFEPALLCCRFERPGGRVLAERRGSRACAPATRREAEANVDVFAAAAAPRPPVCFGADAAPSLAARDGAAAASAPRSTALQQRAVQSGYRHDSWRRRLFTVYDAQGWATARATPSFQ